MGKEKECKLVLIEWTDSYGCSASWQSVEEVEPEVMTCQSVGWLIYDGETCKVIVPHLSQTNFPHAVQQGCGDMTIPASAVVRIRELRVGKTLRRGSRKRKAA